MTKILISVSKSKSKSKSKNPRSAFLSAFMSELASNGDLIPAFFGKDKEAFLKKFDELRGRIAAKMPNTTSNKG